MAKRQKTSKGLILILMAIILQVLGLRRQTGEGTVTYSDTGATYTGAWLNGKRHGEGTYTNPNGEVLA